MDAIADAIEARYNGAGGATIRGLSNALEFENEEEIPGEFIRHMNLSTITDSIFKKGSALERIDWQFSIFSDSRNREKVALIFAALIALFDDVKLTPTGYSYASMQRVGQRLTRDAGGWHWSVNYQITAQKT